MKQQIFVSGIGGQGVLFLTRVIAQAAVAKNLPVLTAETHGMAQRGGTVLSTIKVGDFASPLIRSGQADVGLVLWEANLAAHEGLLKPGGGLLLNTPRKHKGLCIDATGLARDLGNAVLANLVLLGLAVRHGVLFCDAQACREAIRALAPEKFLAQNLEALALGLKG